ncbi:MAG TPA: hypothetical protein VMS93_04745 [Candidatus Saccharimonadales bacterium]|nr:hypothetical protein [Candidatus Saccharimonadales bacterium]
MFNPKRLAIAIAAGLALAAPAAPARAQALDRYFPAAGVHTVVLRVDEGLVHCGSGPLDDVHLLVHGSSHGLELRAMDVVLAQRVSHDTLELTLKLRLSPNLPAIRATGMVELGIPGDIRPAVELGIGDIEARDLESGGRLEAAEGSIRVTGATGPLELRTVDGTAWARDVDGTLRAVTRDGQVDVAGRLDAVVAEARDGSLDIDASRGSTAPEGGGGGWLLRTRGGDIKLKLPKEFAGVLAARTGSGELDPGPYPVPPKAPGSPGEGGASLRVLLGEGSGQIRVESESGDIRLR